MQLPFDATLEQAALGAAIMSKDALVKFMDVVQPDVHFHDTRHLRVAKAIHELAKANAAVDMASVTSAVKDSLLVADLSMGAFLPSNMDYYLQQLQAFGIRRQLVKAGQEIIATASNTDAPLDKVTATASRLVSQAVDVSNEDAVTTHAAMTETLDRIILAKCGTAKLGLPTGFSSLDSILVGGLQPGHLVIVAARPGMGKSAFAMDVAYRCAANGGVVVVFSLEMSRDDLNIRLLSSVTGIAHYKLLTGDLEDAELARLTEAVTAMENMKLFIFDKGDITPAGFVAKCKRIKHEHGQLDLGVVDYLQIMNLETGNKQDSSVNKLEAGTRALKRGAVEIGAPVIVLSQLSRGVEESARPTLQRLRGSGSIEQDADKVMFLYRPGYYFPEMASPEVTEVIVAKNRQGRCDTVELQLNLKTTAFREAV